MSYYPKVLVVLDYAPDYREAFFRELGLETKLTVVAQPCEAEGLTAPPERKHYEYREILAKRIGGIYWQPGLRALASKMDWDVICMGINLRHPARVTAFLSLPSVWSKWVWRGHIFGKTESQLINYFRGILLRRAAGCLTYSQVQAEEVLRRFGVNAVSFNNSEVRVSEFRQGIHAAKRDGLKLLFVGRYQTRKRLERFIDLASRRSDISVRLVGPDMDRIDVPQALDVSGRVEKFGKTSGEALNEHFDWADLVANPGHVGLLVMNAARHQKGIVIDSESRHAPEYWLAKEAGQPFIDFSDCEAVDQFLDGVIADPTATKVWAERLQELARSRYTIEYMVDAHLKVFNNIYESNG
jgi:glycosyltransferase involved in cell wall biosynthesis